MNKNYLLVLFLFTSIAFSQDKWQTMMFDKTANFYDIQNDFNLYYNSLMSNSNKIPKGSGIKQYKRWEYYWENRVDANGNFPQEGNVAREIELFNSKTQNKISKTYDPGTGTWELVGPTPVPANGTGQPNGNGRTTCVAFHPTDPNTVFVGAPSGGVWKTTDNGVTWAEFSGGLTRLGVSSIVIDPNTPSTMYIGTGDRDGGDAPGYGVWRSTDGGISWTSRNNGMGNRTVYEVLMDPTDSNILIASTNGSRIYRSIDGGANWSFTSSVSSCKDIAFHPTNSNIIYASGTSLNRSTDNGATFTQITSGVPAGTQRMALAVSINQPNWVYLLAGDGSGLVGVYRATDSGLNFTTRTTTPNILGYDTTGGTGSQAWYDLVIAADPTDANIIYTGAVNIWKSVDGGSTMTLSAHWTGSGGADDVHADHHALEFSPHTNAVFNGNDGGLYVTNDSGTVWNDLSSGLAIAQVYKIGVSQTVEGLVINGYQDNGTAISRDTSFSTEIGGDGMECIIDPTDANFMYGALYYGDIRRSTNGGNSFTSISDPTGEAGGWVTPYKLDPNNANTMFAGYDDVWRNDAVRTGTTWAKISSFANTSNMVDLAIAPSNSNIMYVSKGGTNNFYRTNDALAGSPTWTDLDANLPVTGTPKDIEIDPTDPTHLFIALGNNIYESINSGGSWTDVSGTLPNISLNTIVIDTNSPVNAMYVGMDVGVYYKDNTMADWTAYSSGLANLEITELEIQVAPDVCRGKLFAATYGQGLWKSDLKDNGNVAPIACFEAETVNGCMGNSFVINDYSAYTPTGWSWTITPATFNFINSTTASSQNIEVVFTAAGTYTVELTTTNGTGNDTRTKASYITVENAALAPSFNDDFETEALCAITTDCGTTVCPLTGSWLNLTNGTDDNIDWRIDEGGTASNGTGPSVDYNPGTATGNYAYLEASGGCNNSVAILESACVNLDVAYDFELGYHMSGINMGSLHIDLFASGTWTNDIITPISGDQGTNWQLLTVDLAAYTGQTVKLRVRGIIGTGFESDLAIDDLKFTVQTPLDVNDTVLEASGVTLYPNPATNEFNVINPERLQLNELVIYDLAGRVINKIDLTDAERSKAINISNLEKAVYLIHIKGEEGEMIEKLIKK